LPNVKTQERAKGSLNACCAAEDASRAAGAWRRAFYALKHQAADLRELAGLPTIDIDLMYARTADNDPFYGRITKEFYVSARRRHPKFPLVRRLTQGVAVCTLPSTFDEYFSQIEAAGRRNFKKANRNGFTFAPIAFNDFLDDVGRIRRSTEYRQGRVPETLLSEDVEPCANPASRNGYHDYPYFGIIRDDALYAYAGCRIAGELCMIEHILGDAAVQSEGIVPMLILSIATRLKERYPAVKYFAYGSYFGAREEMRRFKRKFLFLPHRVRWHLGDRS